MLLLGVTLIEGNDLWPEQLNYSITQWLLAVEEEKVKHPLNEGWRVGVGPSIMLGP